MLTNILLIVIIILLALILSVLIEFYRVISLIKNIEIVAEQVANGELGEDGDTKEFYTSQSDVYELKRIKK